MKKKCFYFVILFLGLSIIVSSRPAAAKRVDKLTLKGMKLVNGKGKTVQLKGVSTHGIAWFPQYVNKNSFHNFQKWGANTIRLALYSDRNAGYDKTWYKTVDKGVKYASELGMFVIIDWHILSDGNPRTNQKEAEKFFRRMAKKYKKYSNIIYEICNEPNGDVTWKRDIKPYANKIIKVIRKYDKDAVIIVGTPNWSQDVDIVSENPIKGQKNIMYALHFYAATHKQELRNKLQKALNNKLPVFVSEFSICDASGSGGIDYGEANKWINMLNKNKISYVAWNISNKKETSALIRSNCKKTGKWKKSDLSASGKWLIKQLKKGK